jgi:hypothetical protein
MSTFEYDPNFLSAFQKDDPWVHTASGGKFHFLHPRPGEVLIEDVAQHLSQKVRFSGAGQFFYSVAQHCINGAMYLKDQGDLTLAYHFLHHDDEEFVLPDLPSPLKHLIRNVWTPIEERVFDACADAFNLSPNVYNNPKIKEVDIRLRETEARRLFPGSWEAECEPLDIYIPQSTMHWRDVTSLFTAMHHSYRKELGL